MGATRALPTATFLPQNVISPYNDKYNERVCQKASRTNLSKGVVVMSLTLEQQVKWLFRINAVINVVLSIRGIEDPAGMAALFGGPVPNYPFLIRLWLGLVMIEIGAVRPTRCVCVFGHVGLLRT
jgi:hypothetical protein